MKRVITYGTFDLLHYGHINLLKRAKQYGDYLIVALSTDEFNWNAKQKCYFSYEKENSYLKLFATLIQLFLKKIGNKSKRYKEYHADYFVMGDDWAGHFDELEQLTDAQVIYLPRTPEISTTQIKNELNSLNSDK